MITIHRITFIIISGIVLPFSIGWGFEIRDGWYYVNGEKFFIKGIGYETHTRPGQVPWQYDFNADLIRSDLQRMRNAGFNTIRTWGALSEEELVIVQESGLKILFGIWIDPHGDYSDPGFRNSSIQHISEVLAYTKNYSCILAYIIMNEPLVTDILAGGPENLVSLWDECIDLIHQHHPGVPVTISNTAVGDYIRSDLFQIGAYNLYIYNPVLISHSHGYAGYCEFIREHRSQNMPFIITEYGLSVSPGSVGDTYGYGGNTFEQQEAGNLLMYRELIDGGAQGGCVFQYHDGWWKGGDENSHDINPEEWFGLIEFDSNPGNMEGTPRPVWEAYTAYNRAIVWQPKNQQIYVQSVPIELFMTDTIARVTIEINGDAIADFVPANPYYCTEITPVVMDSVRDIIVMIKFFNQNNSLIKMESISALLIKSAVSLPSLKITLLPENLASSNQLHIILDVTKNPLFTIQDNRLDYAYFPHIGFSTGEARMTTIPDDSSSWRFTDFFASGNDVMVATFGAGFTIEYGSFEKRVYAQKIIYRDNWAQAIAAPVTVSETIDPVSLPADINISLYNFPNPFNSSTTISFNLSQPDFINISLIDLTGQLVATPVNSFMNRGNYRVVWDAGVVPSGIYLILMQTPQHTITHKIVLLK
ncbi:MAG: T9SS type A sorting domain-containing protein [Fidelibacterota bacterium]